MKDLIAKLQMDANCALGAIWMHIDAQAARIAELEAQIAAASAPAVDQHPNELRAWLSKLEDEVMPLHSDAKKLFTRVRTYLQACGYFKKPLPADTDKLREALKLAVRQNSCDMLMTGEEIRKCEAALNSTALQAPVREVPEGWQLVPKEPTGVMKDAGAYALPVDYSSTSAAANAYRAMLAAAPVQQEGDRG